MIRRSLIETREDRGEMSSVILFTVALGMSVSAALNVHWRAYGWATLQALLALLAMSLLATSLD